ncbi:MAG: DUF6279 family lipoprotein [Vibrio sp.]
MRNRKAQVKLGLVALMSVFVLAGCVFQTAYDKLDWATVFTINRYVSLESAQKEATRADMRQLLRWHKQNEIPKLKRVMETIDAKPSAQTSAALLAAQWDLIEASMWRTYDELEPYAYRFLRSLDQEQSQELLTYLRKKYQKRIDKYSKRSQEENRKRDLKNFSELVEYWIGDLNAEQKTILKNWSVDTQRNYSLEVAQYMLAQVNQFARIFEPHPDEAAYRKTFAAQYAKAKTGMPAKLQQGLNANKKGKAEVLSQLLKTLTPKQEREYRSRLDEWQDNFTFED